MRKYEPSGSSQVMSRDEVRDVDNWAINVLGIPGVVLMENAGRSCSEFIKDKLSGIPNPLVIIFCGTGNNGGDGFVVARHLSNAGIGVRVVICGNAFKIKGDAKINLDIITKIGIPIQQIDVDWRKLEKTVADYMRGASLLVDGLFGTGLQGHLEDRYVSLINALNKQGVPIVAIDIPSGIDCDSGHVLGAAIKAEATITFVAVKKGFLNPEAIEYTGQIYVADIGIQPLKSQ